MKQNLLRIGCAAAGLALAAGVFTSCSLLPTPSRPVSHPQLEEEPPKYDASSLRDGRLRLFSSYDSLGGNTILCGDKVVHQSPASETSYLLTDSQTGETNWFVCTWSDPDTAAGRRSGIFDRTGEALYTFDREYDVRLSGGVLVLTTPTSFAYSPLHDHAAGDVRVLDFASGTEYPVPENAYTCLVAGDRLAFGLYAPGDAAPDEENDDLYQYAAVQIQEKDGTVVYQNFHGLLYSLSAGIDDPLAPADWVEIDTYNADGTSLESTSLLNAATGEERSGFVTYLHAGIASFRTDEGKYQLVDLVSDMTSTVLCEFDDSISGYAPGVTVLYREGGYLLYDLNTGDTLDLYNMALGTNTLDIYARDGTLRVYDMDTGAIRTDTTVAPLEALHRTDLYDQGSGWVNLRQYDNDNYDVTTLTLAGPTLSKTLSMADLTARYGDDFDGYLWPVTATEDDFYFSISYRGPGSTWLYDLLDSDGAVVLAGLGSCGEYSRYNSSAPLPAGVFVARKGFDYGWMDVEGNWIYCQSIFTSTSDETDNYFY